MTDEGQCRVCGCDEWNACFTDNGPCHWVEGHDSLCSACAPTVDHSMTIAPNKDASELTVRCGCGWTNSLALDATLDPYLRQIDAIRDHWREVVEAHDGT